MSKLKAFYMAAVIGMHISKTIVGILGGQIVVLCMLTHDGGVGDMVDQSLTSSWHLARCWWLKQ